ncbi:MAG: ROK family protein [Lactobacillus equicursoris]|uniref:ROK family protein n=1 Tax=Lactobacillus equicursoris TaxID=420645 RepID=UPI002430D060|nr:ROK family protein [Lactobacillus equicursoris]MDD6406633.1 ROK family protein [Lactobacillus equicursoris]
MTQFVGSIEAGGTKFVLGVQNVESGETVATKRVPTTTPAETLEACRDFFKENPVNALAIGSFGPIDINPNSKTFGYITKTPKPGWSNTELKGYFERELGVPAVLTTDVNASCYGEYIARGRDNEKTYLYITIGTGVGAGAIQQGHFIGYTNHSEMGHMRIPKRADDNYEDNYEGGCPFHGDACGEGLTAGPTLKGRTGIPGEDLDRDNPVFDLISYYVAEMLYNIYLTIRPDVMVVGGSVLNEGDMPTVRKYFKEMNNDYVEVGNVDELIVRPIVPNNGSAVLGCYEMAKDLLK